MTHTTRRGQAASVAESGRSLNHWEPRGGELVVPFDPAERARYECGQSSIYDRWAWPTALLYGRDRRNSRCFPEIAARAHFEQQGYSALLSAPQYPDGLGYLLFHFRGMRRRTPPHPAFVRMQRQFPNSDLNQLAEEARLLKIASCNRGGGGGDPDLFVFRPGTNERFFVEAKDLDSLNCNQRVCFAMIEERLGCLVRVARLVPSAAC